MNSFDLLVALKNNGYLKTGRDPLWWPKSHTFWVIVGAILTQQSKWEKVELSMLNLQNMGIDSLESIANASLDVIIEAIRPSGFYNTKAKNLHRLSCSIIHEFGNFTRFQNEVEREWLLAQRGIGPESADSILCYACGKDAMVVDAYTARLLASLGYDFETYDALQEWMVEGLYHHREALERVYGRAISTNEVYARFHGKIVEFCKEKSKGRLVDSGSLGL